MKHRVQTFIAGFIAFTVIAGARTATAQPNAGGPPLPISKAWPYAGDILLRQIARQSFFLAEREGLHLPTRDASLGEAGDNVNSTIQPLVTVFAEQVDLKISLVRQVGQKPLWSTTIVRGDEPSDYQAAVERAEALSRGELLDAL